MDLRDAAGSISLQAVQNAVAKHAPEIQPFVQWLYNVPTQPTLDRPQTGNPRGLHPADPCSRLLFALTLSEVLKEREIQQRYTGVGVLAHQDSVILQGNPCCSASGFGGD